MALVQYFRGIGGGGEKPPAFSGARKDRVSSMSLPKITDDFIRVSLLGAAAAFVGAAITTAVIGHAASATVMVGGLLVCLIFLYLSRFKRFKGFGVEGEMWEDKMQEAERVIDRLNKLAAATAAPTYRAIASVGRWTSAPDPNELALLVDPLDNALRDAGFSEDRINDIKAPVHIIKMTDLRRERGGEEFVKAVEAMINKRGEPVEKFTQPYNSEAQEAMAIQRQQVDELKKLIAAAKVDLGPSTYTLAADNIEKAINENTELTKDERNELTDIAGPMLSEMRQYLTQNRCLRADINRQSLARPTD